MSITEDYNNLQRMINGEELEDSYQIKRNIKEYIFNNPNDMISISIKKWLFNKIQDAFLNPKLKNAFNMSDEFKYTKILEIFKYLPFMNTDDDIPSYFYSLLTTDSSFYGSYPNFYRGSKWFCNEMNKGFVPDELFDMCIDYCEKQKSIMRGSRNKYDTYEYAYQTLRILNIGHITPEYKSRYKNIKEYLYWNHQNDDDYNVKQYFKNEKKGVVGEYFIYNWLKLSNGETTFVARDYGNGFGYDILHKTNDMEYLIEVKSTENQLNENDYFEITENEKDVLEDSLNLPKTEYILERVFIDVTKNRKTHLTLRYDSNNNCFYCNNLPEYNIKYVQNPEKPLEYKAVIEKKNTLTYKNNNQ